MLQQAKMLRPVMHSQELKELSILLGENGDRGNLEKKLEIHYQLLDHGLQLQ